MHIQQLFDLSGRVAVVSGGAGKYGRQIVEALAEAGAHVVMASRDVGKLERVAAGFAEQNLSVEARKLDLSDDDSIEALHAGLIADGKHAQVLVNNAVARIMTKGWSDTGDTLTESLRANATGPFLMTRTFGEAMAEAGGGSIINIGSIQGMVGMDQSLYEGLDMSSSPDYYVHKGGLMQLTRYAAAHFGPQGVRVNTVSPGGIFADQNPTFVERYEKRTFLGRMGNQTDLKGAIVYLASDASAYVTGTNLVVDGGYTEK
jgi:NAD(P)-dependent dehydrogenase (short-subunit alcohol dehydrogenase family)